MSEHAKPASTESKSKKAPKKRGIWNVVLVLSIVVLIGSLAALGVIGYSYWEGQQKYENVAETAQFNPDDAMTSGEEVDLTVLNVDWDALRAINSDIVAWLYVPNTRINYPIVRGEDNDYYLSHDFEYQEGWVAHYGTPFMDYRNERNLSDQAIFMYGHHMNDGSMFAVITDLKNQTRFDECRTVYLLTPQGNYRLRSFSLVHASAYESIVQPTFYSDEAFEYYVQEMINRSMVDPGDIPDASDIHKVFALITCDGYTQLDYRHILMCYIEASTVPGEQSANGEDEDIFDKDAVAAIGGETSHAIDPLGGKSKDAQRSS